MECAAVCLYTRLILQLWGDLDRPATHGNTFLTAQTVEPRPAPQRNAAARPGSDLGSARRRLCLGKLLNERLTPTRDADTDVVALIGAQALTELWAMAVTRAVRAAERKAIDRVAPTVGREEMVLELRSPRFHCSTA